MKHSLRVLCVMITTILLSGCGDTIDKKTGDFDGYAAIVNGSIKSEGGLEDLFYEGTGEVVRYSCAHSGKISLVIKSNASFQMTVTTPTVGSNCEPGGDFESAKISGTVNETGDEMRFFKCNYNETPPEGLGNYTLKRAAGGVSCYDTNAANKIEKWLSVTFDLKRVIDGKIVE